MQQSLCGLLQYCDSSRVHTAFLCGTAGTGHRCC